MANRRPFASKPTMPGATSGSSGPNNPLPDGPDASGTASPVAAATSRPGAVPASIPRVNPFSRGSTTTRSKPHTLPKAIGGMHSATPRPIRPTVGGAQRRAFGGG